MDKQEQIRWLENRIALAEIKLKLLQKMHIGEGLEQVIDELLDEINECKRQIKETKAGGI